MYKWCLIVIATVYLSKNLAFFLVYSKTEIVYLRKIAQVADKEEKINGCTWIQCIVWVIVLRIVDAAHMQEAKSMFHFRIVYFVLSSLCVLTYAADGQQTSWIVGWRTIREEWLQDVCTECKSNNCLWARPHNHAFNPQTDECHEWPKRFHDVGIIGSRFTNHCSQLCIAVCSNLIRNEIMITISIENLYHSPLSLSASFTYQSK